MSPVSRRWPCVIMDLRAGLLLMPPLLLFSTVYFHGLLGHEWATSRHDTGATRIGIRHIRRSLLVPTGPRWSLLDPTGLCWPLLASAGLQWPSLVLNIIRQTAFHQLCNEAIGALFNFDQTSPSLADESVDRTTSPVKYWSRFHSGRIDARHSVWSSHTHRVIITMKKLNNWFGFRSAGSKHVLSAPSGNSLATWRTRGFSLTSEPKYH